MEKLLAMSTIAVLVSGVIAAAIGQEKKESTRETPPSPAASAYTFARQRVEAARRQTPTKMPAWLKEQRAAYLNRMLSAAQKSFEETGIWFLARGASRVTDEMETAAVWGGPLAFVKLEEMPGYSEERRQQAIEFWQSWQNRKTGRLYNPLYQDPQNPEIKRNTPGNRKDYSPDAINLKYVPAILGMLRAKLPAPCKTEAHADAAEETFDRLWEEIAQWSSSHSGIFPVNAARELDAGRLEKIPQVEAGMGALVRAYNKETGMWRPEPLKGFPWQDYPPSSGFKIISRLCGYVGMENFPEALTKTAIDNLLAHRSELYAEPATARNYSETMAHYLMLTDYRHGDLLDAMEECLNGFRSPTVWENTGTGTYCQFGTGLIGAFMNWEDLPFDRAMQEPGRFEHGCKMKWRFVADPFGNWVNAIPKRPEEIYGHLDYDVGKYGLKARNKAHWAKKIMDVIPQRDVVLTLGTEGKTGRGTFVFALTQDQLARRGALYLKATWRGAYDVSLNGEPVKQVRYDMPDLPVGWYVPATAAGTLRAGENAVSVNLIGAGKEQKPGAPPSEGPLFVRLGVIVWE